MCVCWAGRPGNFLSPWGSLADCSPTVSQYCKHQELETLKDLYNQDDNHQELGSFHVRASYMAEEVWSPWGE